MGNIFSYSQDKTLEVGGHVYRDGGLDIGQRSLYIEVHGRIREGGRAQ